MKMAPIVNLSFCRLLSSLRSSIRF